MVGDTDALCCRGRPRVCKLGPDAGGIHRSIFLMVLTAVLPGAAWADYVTAKWSQAQRTGLYLSEDEARFLFHQFITAVAYCHGKSVAHRLASHRRLGPRNR